MSYYILPFMLLYIDLFRVVPQSRMLFSLLLRSLKAQFSCHSFFQRLDSLLPSSHQTNISEHSILTCPIQVMGTLLYYVTLTWICEHCSAFHMAISQNGRIFCIYNLNPNSLKISLFHVVSFKISGEWIYSSSKKRKCNLVSNRRKSRR